MWRKRAIFFSLVMSLAAVASAAIPARTDAAPALRGQITFRSTEALKRPSPLAHAVSGIGHFTISGVITDKGKVTDHRTQKGDIAVIKRVAVGEKGTITFTLTINVATGKETWTIASGTKAYKGLHGKGKEVLDAYYESPARFVMKGTVSQ